MPFEHDIGDSAKNYNPHIRGLTVKQRELLRFITEEFERHGVPPSYDEMKDHLGLKSKSGVHRLVHALKDRGHISMLATRARTISPIVARQPLAESLRDVLHRCDLTRYAERELKALLEAEAA